MGKKDEIKASNPIAHYFQENMGILIALVGLCIFLEIMNQRFFTWSNWLTILDNVSKTGFLAIGIMLCIMLGGIDLIAGAGIACSGVLCICCMERWHLPMVVAIIAGLLVGLIAGMANGFIIAYSGIHPFVVTLAMQSILRGIAYLLANAQPVPLYVNEVFLVISMQSAATRQQQGSPVSTSRRSRSWCGPSPVSSVHSQESSFPRS